MEMTPVSSAKTTLTVSTQPGAGRSSSCEPITVGIPMPRGLVNDARGIGLVDAGGKTVPLQALPTERWPDGSIRWALLDFQAAGAGVIDRRYELTFHAGATALAAPRVHVTEETGRIVVDTGAAHFEMRPGMAFPFSAATADGKPPIDAASSAFVVTDQRGHSWRARITKVEIEDRGELRSSVRLDGFVGPRHRPLLQVIARVHFFAGSAATRVAITVRNPRRARHRGGFWELGDHGSVYMRDASLHVVLPSGVTSIECAPERELVPQRFAVPFELVQDSSGGEQWRHPTHVNGHGEVPCTFRGYQLRAGGEASSGLRATPVVTASHASGMVLMAVEHFWQNFPKAIEAGSRNLTLRLWPRQYADVHEIQGGEQKTHTFTLALGSDPMSRDAMFWGRAPAIAAATPEWYSSADAIGYLTPAAQDTDRRYRQLVDAAIDGDETFDRKRETMDEYGWRHFGDTYADHENPFSRQAEPIVSHYNNQYDAVNGFGAQFMRTGDLRWWRLMTELATHVTDIDIYHTDRDKAAFNNGLFWHTFHYVAAGRSSHRSYPRQDGVCGGGPGNEHNYAAGLRLHWLMTGDRLSRDAAIGLAGWVINMDDGCKTILRWLAPSYTGLASATQSPDYHGPGRGAGHSIMALLEGHRLTGERRYLEKAEQLIRRCVHPSDDIDRLDLLDAEHRWSYTVFLQAVGKFLDYKLELGQTDASYAYARAALLHYARWMAQHERPYYDQRERLEYPTETWPAQDVRKSDVFSYAAQLAEPAERERFTERARFFFDYSMTTLLQEPTRVFARPVILLLSNGFLQLGGRARTDHPKPADVPVAHFGSPEQFAPQKAIAKKRLMAMAGAAAAAVTMLGAAIVRMAL
jgi:exo-rhamnogalacturonan lyase-like protein